MDKRVNNGGAVIMARINTLKTIPQIVLTTYVIPVGLLK